MNTSYFNVKREIKKIYGLCLKAIKQKDISYINFLLLNLDNHEDKLKKMNIDSFGLHVLKKEIEGMRFFLITKLQKKKAEDLAHEKKSRRNTSQPS